MGKMLFFFGQKQNWMKTLLLMAILNLKYFKEEIDWNYDLKSSKKCFWNIVLWEGHPESGSQWMSPSKPKESTYNDHSTLCRSEVTGKVEVCRPTFRQTDRFKTLSSSSINLIWLVKLRMSKNSVESLYWPLQIFSGVVKFTCTFDMTPSLLF